MEWFSYVREIGIWQCINSIYKNFKLNFFLIVDQPEIEQEETFIHTQEGDETEVICVVHASPKAEIKWFKVKTKYVILTKNEYC